MSRRNVDTSVVDGRVALEVLLPLAWLMLVLALAAWRFVFLPPDQFWDFLDVRNLRWLAFAGSLHLFLLWLNRRR